TGIAALAFTASAVTTTATLTAAPARADISCPDRLVPPSVSPDCYFLYMMARDKFQANSQAGLINDAHYVCSLMDSDTGADPVYDVAVRVQRGSPTTLSIQQAGLFT